MRFESGDPGSDEVDATRRADRARFVGNAASADDVADADDSAVVEVEVELALCDDEELDERVLDPVERAERMAEARRVETAIVDAIDEAELLLLELLRTCAVEEGRDEGDTTVEDVAVAVGVGAIDSELTTETAAITGFLLQRRAVTVSQ